MKLGYAYAFMKVYYCFICFLVNMSWIIYIKIAQFYDPIKINMTQEKFLKFHENFAQSI